MTVLDAAPLCFPVNPKRLRLIGTLLIFGAFFLTFGFFISLWYGEWLPTTTIYGVEADWYYQCLIPAVFPVTAFFAYWIWLSSQYFRYA